jgi:outer membrane protein assembly factor BamB
MSAPTTAPARLFSLRRYGVPFLIVVLAVSGAAALWLAPGLAPDSRAGNTFFLFVASMALLTLWLVLFSGFRWYFRVAVVLIEAAVVVSIQPHLVFNGDMVPHLRSPWENHDEEIEQSRREQANLSFAPVELSDRPTDWPEFRGRHRDGIVRGPQLSRDWTKKPPRLVWKQPCGDGFGSFAISGTLAITLEQRRKDYEAVVAYDAGTGREVWKYEYAARFYEPLGGLGPRSTPTISEGEVFSLGATGLLVCLDAKTGEHKWTIDVLEGGSNLPWGMAGSPLVIGNRVIVATGSSDQSTKNDRAVVAYDRHHEILWAGTGQKGGYSSPMLASSAGFERVFGLLDGAKQVVIFSGKELVGYDLETGRRLWDYPWQNTQQDINVAQPVIWDDGRIFISSGYGIGCAMLQIKHVKYWSCNLLWRNENKPLRCKLSSCVERDGFIYGLDEDFLACIDSKDGSLLWRDGRYGHGQLLRQDDLLIILDERGNIAMAEATPNGYHEIGKVKAIHSERTWNVPAMVDGRIFVRNDKEMACFDLRD